MNKGVILITFTILGFCMGFWCKQVRQLGFQVA